MQERTKRILMTTVGIFLCGVGVSLFKAAAFGTDPFQVLCDGVSKVVPIPFGTLYVIINVVLLVAMFFLDKHYIGLGTVLNLFLLGYIIQFGTQLLAAVSPSPGMGLRVAYLGVGIVILCLASALYFTADLGVSTYDVWALVLAKRTPIPFRFLRIGTDLICVGVGFLLGGKVGVGTIITAFFMGPLVDLFNRKIAQPLRYGKTLETK